MTYFYRLSVGRHTFKTQTKWYGTEHTKLWYTAKTLPIKLRFYHH